MAVPTTKTARQAAIREILATRGIRSQAELSDALGDRGLSVTQGTLSRDLLELGASRVRGTSGHLVYAVPADGGDRRQQRTQQDRDMRGGHQASAGGAGGSSDSGSAPGSSAGISASIAARSASWVSGVETLR